MTRPHPKSCSELEGAGAGFTGGGGSGDHLLLQPVVELNQRHLNFAVLLPDELFSVVARYAAK